MQKVYVPPIKCQGIKTKLVYWIKELVPMYDGIWFEPFMGSGVVGFNINPKKAVFSDTNPHIIRFYNDLKYGNITALNVREFLEGEHEKLLEDGDNYYKEVRKRFNEAPNSLDFLFLNRSCFNGMIRFNSSGEFNTPFCKKNNRFVSAYITKICNQVSNIQQIINFNDYTFLHQSFDKTIKMAKKHDFIYCDPPYIDRHSDYFNKWIEQDEFNLFDLLNETEAKFILSTWHNNQYRENKYISLLWKKFSISTKNHFYHVGAIEENRHPMVEALIYNFISVKDEYFMPERSEQMQLIFT